MGVLDLYFTKLQEAIDKKEAAYTALKYFENISVGTPPTKGYNALYDELVNSGYSAALVSFFQYNQLDEKRNALSNEYIAANAAYEIAKTEYEEAKNTLATPEEVEAYNQVEQAEADRQTAEAEAASFAANSTKYYIVAGVVLLTLAAVIIYYRYFKRGAKAA